MWGADVGGQEVICTGLRLELGSANTNPRRAGSKVTQGCGMGGHMQHDSSREEVQRSWTLWDSKERVLGIPPLAQGEPGC